MVCQLSLVESPAPDTTGCDLDLDACAALAKWSTLTPERHCGTMHSAVRAARSVNLHRQGCKDDNQRLFLTHE